MREGASRKDDMFPYRMLTDPLPVGNKKFPPLKEADIDDLLDEYYDENGWDKNTGKPTMKTHTNFGLKKEGGLVLDR